MGPEQWLFLQWHEHKGSLISTFEKLFERNTFVDCTLAAEGQYLNVHKMILSACSPYFEILLNENRDKHPIIILKDVKFRSLKSIIEYMYRGEANVLSTEIKDFLSAAETLQIKGLGKQGGGDTKNAPPKELRDFMEADSLTTGSQVISHDSGEKEMWRNPDLASVLTETSCESATQNNTAFSQGDHLPTKKIAPQRIAVPVMRVEEENESKWPKMEDNDEPRKCLKAVMPTLNLGTHAMEPVHHATVDKVLDLNVCSTSNQSVPSTNDAQMSIELTRKNELEPEPQQAHGTRETEEVETASVASSAIEVSDTTEEWAEEDIEEGPTPSQATGHSAAAGTDESHPLFDASNMTRDSVSRNIANDHQGTHTARHLLPLFTASPQASLPNDEQKFIRASSTCPPVDAAIQWLLGATANVLVKEPRPHSSGGGGGGSSGGGCGGSSGDANGASSVRVVTRCSANSHRPRGPPRASSPHAKHCESKELDGKSSSSINVVSSLNNEELIQQLRSVFENPESIFDEKLSEKTPSHTQDDSNHLKSSRKIVSQATIYLLKENEGTSSKINSSRTIVTTYKHICPVCYKSFRWLDHLKKHMQTHRRKKLHKCKECNYTNPEKIFLLKHPPKHLKDGPSFCQVCELNFRTKKKLAKHIDCVHIKEKKAKKRQKPKRKCCRISINRELYQCSECNYATRQPNAFINHLLRHSNIRKRQESDEFEPLGKDALDSPRTSDSKLMQE